MKKPKSYTEYFGEAIDELSIVIYKLIGVVGCALGLSLIAIPACWYLTGIYMYLYDFVNKLHNSYVEWLLV